MKSTVKTPKKQLQTIFAYLLALGILVIHISLHEYGFDDAYIHFRVAGNFVDTGVPYYNSLESVKVSTSTGWIIILYPVVFLTRLLHIQDKLPFFVSVLNSIFTFLGMLTYTKILRLIRSDTNSLFRDTVFQIVYIALMTPSSVGLMETPFALLLAGFGIYLLLSSRSEGYILLGFAAYTRIELVILILIAGSLDLIRGHFSVKYIVLYTVVGVMPMFVFDMYYFHTILPQSIAAKSIIYSIDRTETIWRIIALSFPVQIPISNDLIADAIRLGLLVSIFFLAGVKAFQDWQSAKRTHLALFLIWAVMVMGAYIWKHALMFGWYVPLFMIPMIVGLNIVSRTTESRHKVMTNIVMFSVFMISLISLGQTFLASFGFPNKFNLFETEARVKTYREVARILYAEYPHARLLSSEIGGLGYEFRGEVLDAAGLATPEALKYHPLKVPDERIFGNMGAIPPAFVEETLPEIIVSYDIFDMALMKSQVSDQYNIIKIPAFLPEDEAFSDTGLIWGSQYLRVYIRKDLPISEKILELEAR